MTEKRASKLNSKLPMRKASARKSVEGDIKNLKNQYNIIREDVLKLRADLQKGYDMARGMVDRKSMLKDFLKAK